MSRGWGEETAAERDGGSRPRIRLARRRWRLWWRYQLRTVRRRGGVRRVRLLREPGDDVVLSGAQLWVGRRLGRLYLGGKRAVERGRIERSQIPDRVEPVRTTLALVRAQRGLLLGLVGLILVGLVVDSLVRRFGPSIASDLGLESWAREAFTRPDDDTIRNLLAAAAAGTATILGLVLSISLIVWQATADRYRSTTVVGFLLRERTSTAVVRLLALGFAYSLWVLALFEIAGRPAYVSALIALLLSTTAVLSLIGYRQTGLLGYLPSNIAHRLSKEIVQEQRRAATPWAGRSVADHSRRVVADDLQIFDDLVAHLLEEGDVDDAAACVQQLARAVSHCVVAKPALDPDSPFFERRKEPLPGLGAVGLVEGLASEGLMTPMTDVPDHLWIERRAMAIGRRVAGSTALLSSQALAESLQALWANPLQYAWYSEDDDAVDLILDQVEALAVDDTILDHPQIVEDLAMVAWLVVEAVGVGLQVTSEAIVDSKPWATSTRPRRDFPWRAQSDARDLGLRIRNEINIAGEIVTPRWAMVAAVDERRTTRLMEQQRNLSQRAIKLAGEILARAASSNASSTSRAASMAMRVLLRAAHHQLDLSSAEPIFKPLLKAAAEADGKTADELRDDLGRLARVCAEQASWPLAFGALDVAARAGAIARADEPDEGRAVVLLFDALFTAAVVYAWGEFHQADAHATTAARYVQHPFADLDGLNILLEDHALTRLMLPMMRYYQWFQPLQYRMHELPDRVVDDGGIGYFEEKDHPSDLIAGSELQFGPDECLTALVRAALDDRHWRLEQLARGLREVERRRSTDAAA